MAPIAGDSDGTVKLRATSHPRPFGVDREQYRRPRRRDYRSVECPLGVFSEIGPGYNVVIFD